MSRSSQVVPQHRKNFSATAGFGSDAAVLYNSELLVMFAGVGAGVRQSGS